MEVTITHLGVREFLTLKHPNGKRWDIPMDRIQSFVFQPETVEIKLLNPVGELTFAHENRDAIAKFLDEQGE